MKKSRTKQAKSKTWCHRHCKESTHKLQIGAKPILNGQRTESGTTVRDASVNVELGLDKEM